MNDDLVEIYRPKNSLHAHLLKNLLEDLGVESFVSGEQVHAALGLKDLWEGSLRVYVASRDAEAARKVAVEFDQDLHSHWDDGEENEDDQRPSKSWPDWPTCPSCAARRAAACPLCDTLGENFSLAEFVEDATGPLLVCPNCDDYFRPRFSRTCAACGHDYGTGVDVVVYDTDVINYRAVILTVAVVALGFAIAWYFVAITQ